jgi:hypothetical protein
VNLVVETNDVQGGLPPSTGLVLSGFWPRADLQTEVVSR